MGRKNNILFAGIIFALSFFLRFLYLLQIKTTPLFDFFSADSYHYHIFALRILRGNFVFPEALYLNPFYPLFLAAIYKIFSVNIFIVCIIQIVIDSISSVLLYFIVLKVFERRTVALLAAFVYAAYNLAIFSTAFLLDTTLVSFLYLVSLCFLVYADRRKFFFWLIAGLTLGVSLLLRANALLFIAFLILWSFFSCYSLRKIRIRKVAIMLLSIIIVLLPFSFRHYLIEKNLSPFPVHGGINFYIGNNPLAKGTYMSLKGIPGVAVEQVKASITKAKIETGKDLTPAEASKYWFLKGLEFIKNHPFKFIKLIVLKFQLFLRAEEISGNLNYYFCRRFLPLFKFPFFGWGVVMPFAILGIIFALMQKKEITLIFAFFLSYMGSLLLYFVTWRHRLPVVSVLIMFASYGFYSLFNLIIKNKKAVGWLFLLLSIFFFVNRSPSSLDLKKHFFVAHTNLAAVYHRKRKFNEAIRELKSAIQANPHYVEAYNRLGNIYTDMGKLGEAYEAYRKAIEIDPFSPDAYNNLGLHYYLLGEYDKALAVLKRVLKIAPAADTYNNLGLVYAEMGKFKEAVAAYNKAIELDPDYPDPYNNMGIIYFHLGKKDKASALYKKAIDINPTYLNAYINMGLFYYDLGQVEKSIEYYQKAIEIAPYSIEAYNNLGVAYISQEEMDKAIAVYKKIIALDPAYADAYYNIGVVYEALGELEKALSFFRKTIEINPQHKDAYYNLGVLYKNRGNVEEAIAMFKRAIEISPQADVYNSLGLVYKNAGDIERAISMFKKAIKIDPKYAKAYNNLAIIYFHKKEYKLAIEYCDKALRHGLINPVLLEALQPYREDYNK